MHCRKAFLSDTLQRCLEEFDFVSLFRLFSMANRETDNQDALYAWFLVDIFFRLFLRQVRKYDSLFLKHIYSYQNALYPGF